MIYDKQSHLQKKKKKKGYDDRLKNGSAHVKNLKDEKVKRNTAENRRAVNRIG